MRPKVRLTCGGHFQSLVDPHTLHVQRTSLKRQQLRNGQADDKNACIFNVKSITKAICYEFFSCGQVECMFFQQGKDMLSSVKLTGSIKSAFNDFGVLLVCR